MSLMERIFGTRPQPQPQNPAPTNNLQKNPAPQQVPQQNQQTAPNGVVPAGSDMPPADGSPTDKFADLWDPIKQDGSKTGQEPEGLTPEKMLEAASKVDFKRVLDQDSLAKIQAGGPEAVQALAELLNKASQTVYGQSTVVAQKLMEAQEARLKKEFAEQVPNLVKKHTMRDTFLAENPAFKKPSVAPVVEAIQSQLAQKYPKATTSELNSMAKEYLQAAAADFSPAAPKDTTPAKGEIDWDSYVEGKV